MIKAILLDIDGVLTDGKIYTDGKGTDLKTLNLKDLDAITSMRGDGFIVGCVSGEDTAFSQNIRKYVDFAALGCKDKLEFILDYCEANQIKQEEIVYVGDGKYDMEALKTAGVSVCPADAILAVQKIADWVLMSRGGEGCIAEMYGHYDYMQAIWKEKMKGSRSMDREGMQERVQERIREHCSLAEHVLKDRGLMLSVENVAIEMIRVYQGGGKIFLCGNGGSAADAQHLAAELVGRFYMERRALPAEALTTNSSILTALANDYDYNMIFSRQLQAKGSQGDLLIGITTSGTSGNILQAFAQAKEQGIKTVLMTGSCTIDECKPMMEKSDCVVAVPSTDTPRIQECHIMLGHIICELVEEALFT